MNDREAYQARMRAQLDEFKTEVGELLEKARRAEVLMELEYYTLKDELQLELQEAERKLELLIHANEEKWETVRTDFEQSWKALRELIKAITAP